MDSCLLQICKRRTKVLHSKSPAASKTPQKGYKHLEFLPLQCVKKVLDILEAKDCKVYIPRNKPKSTSEELGNSKRGFLLKDKCMCLLDE
ncbi:hypothetical protein DPMN_136509 [Dreissena polymorpha]|uniref:ECT2 PH domain-containing protein n=1 Tax=Dreissena polymorpha TaxID=45954 RepID=A0A9D4JGS4_DREPO|nr:hypothetical protein DPMN_136509 [Dreissena polymorpha]